jgi:hypothetical protein
MSIPEIQDELLRLEHPYLLPDHDPDIERYYYLRGTGQSQDALYIFDSRLKPRYPDDEFRTSLMRCYRSRHPAFSKLLRLAYRTLADRSLERIRRYIKFISEKVETYNKRDVYATIKTAEDIMRIFPRERYEAAEGIERYTRYAKTMNFHAASMEKAAGLIRAYLTQSLSVVEHEKRRRETLRMREEEQERRRLVKQDWESYKWQKNYGMTPLIDFSSVVFSSADLNRIEIPPSLARLEDQTLAYCVKYWNLVFDPAFERILFLYSRKYGTKNHAVYLAIRRGRITKQRDDEILASVLSALVRGYYYSIRGDRYLQIRWNTVKPLLDQGPANQAPALPPPAPPAASDPTVIKPRTAGPKTVPGKPIPQKSKKTPAEEKNTGRKKDTPPKKASVSPTVQKKKERLSALPAVSMRKKRKSRIPEVSAMGSVSDRLRELSGRSYDLYQDRFLAKARPAIRKILGAGKRHFFTPPEKAENLVYHFLESHYSDPYMNWAESGERTELAEMGFDLQSLFPVIDECYRML